MKLDIGSGLSPARGFVGVDKFVSTAALKADAQVLPFPPASVEEIRCFHALEHLSRAEVPRALGEWMRVMEPGARLTVVVPSMDWVAAVWLHGGDRRYAQEIMFGSQEHEGEFHKTGWRPQDLRLDVEAAGFEVGYCEVEYTHGYHQESIVLRAIKPVSE